MQSLLETWGDPHARHAMLVHIPIVLGMLGIVPLIALAARGFASPTLRWVAVVLFVVLSAGAWLAAGAGEDALEALRRDGGLSSREAGALAVHEWRGERAWVWPLIPAALCAGLGVRGRAIRLAVGSGAAAAGIGVGAWFCVIGHAGGRLVYVHGLGVPQRDPGMVEASVTADPGTDRARSED